MSEPRTHDADPSPADFAAVDGMPRPVRAVFLARCTARVAPLLRAACPHATDLELRLAAAAPERVGGLGATGEREVHLPYSAKLYALSLPAPARPTAAAKVMRAVYFCYAAATGVPQLRPNAPYGRVSAADATGAACQAAAAVYGPAAEAVMAAGVAWDYARLTVLPPADGLLSPEFFGPLWPDDLLAGVPLFREAGRWLAGLTDDFAARYDVRWAFSGAGFPPKIQATVAAAEGGLSSSRDFEWADLANVHYVRGQLSLTWNDLLANKLDTMRAEMALLEG